MMTIIKCFSVLVASGNGSRCIDLRKSIHEHLLSIDEPTEELKVTVFKFGKKKYPEDYKRISTELTKIVSPLYTDVSSKFFGDDNPSKTAATNK